MIGRVRLTPCSRFGNATRIVEHFGAFVEPTSACMTRSATARHRVVHQDQLTGLEDKILGYFAISHARARSAELRARELLEVRRDAGSHQSIGLYEERLGSCENSLPTEGRCGLRSAAMQNKRRSCRTPLSFEISTRPSAARAGSVRPRPRRYRPKGRSSFPEALLRHKELEASEHQSEARPRQVRPSSLKVEALLIDAPLRETIRQTEMDLMVEILHLSTFNRCSGASRRIRRA